MTTTEAQLRLSAHRSMVALLTALMADDTALAQSVLDATVTTQEERQAFVGALVTFALGMLNEAKGLARHYGQEFSAEEYLAWYGEKLAGMDSLSGVHYGTWND